MENRIRTGTIINPKTGKTYTTRDTVNALRLARLVKTLNDWKDKNQHNQSPSVQRKVTALKEVL